MILVDDAAREIDALTPIQRALLCCMYKTTSRSQLAGLVARDTSEAIFGGLIKEERGRAAVAKLIEVHLEMHLDYVEDEYFQDLHRREG